MRHPAERHGLHRLAVRVLPGAADDGGEPVDPVPRHLGVHPAGADGVDLDAGGRELGRESAYEPEQARLRGAVAGVAGDADPRQDRRDDDDVARLRPRREMTLGGTARVVGARQVGRDELVEAVALPVGVLRRDARAGNERVHRAERSGCALDRLVDGLAVADVARADVTPLAELAATLLERRLVEPEQRDGGAVARDTAGDRAPDPRPRPGHNDVSLSHVLSNPSQFA